CARSWAAATSQVPPFQFW
nr:immunoglobulin heavy chain junction region [Macaca mulatta]MOV54636.1 immunoglobulin heavy chain junction region [Macaca mulatta]MOV54791.1 immunoglobulin heavy chain junction region [Macaca mulatta]MOV54920.1 immunoglobulin heavy chain junction region [Macaca mulatta]MOV55508.1 immunoglobulin heavy chain junction region [Macaca mulatta]